MSEIKTDKIKPVDAGSTTTLGDSGDTISTSSGTTLDIQGTYSGINTINWDTTPKTANFTAETNRGYFVNTTSATVTVTLPASPTAGSFIGIKDYALTAQTNQITIDPNGNKIQGSTFNFNINVKGGSANLVYVDSTQGWLTFDAGQSSDIAQAALFTVATGGTITTCGDYKIHTFTGPGTFSVTQIGNSPTVPAGGPQVVEYLVQAAGGGGGGNQGSPAYAAGGGGAGGFRASNGTTAGCYTAGPTPITSPVSGITATVQDYPITVGSGGNGVGPGSEGKGGSGGNSVFSTITSAGGGGGGVGVGPHNPSKRPGDSGGSGGGGGQSSGSGGSGNTPPVSPPQGNSGGTAGPGGAPSGAGAGGGGIGGSGQNGSVGCSVRGGDGGTGASPNIPGTTIYVAQGGGGGAGNNGCTGKGGGPGPGPQRTAGNGGRASPGPFSGSAGTANRGGGGGGSGGPGSSGGNGGSGVVIIRYKYQ